MDDVYRINLAKTEFREAYQEGDVDRLLKVFGGGGFTDMSDGGPSKYGEEATARMRDDAARLFSEYTVKLNVIVINIVVLKDCAYDYGWHEFILRPKCGGEPVRKRHRYFCVGSLAHFIFHQQPRCPGRTQRKRQPLVSE